MTLVMKMNRYIGKHTRVITKVIFRNGRQISTRYFGTVLEVNEKEIILKEADNNITKILLRHIKRIEEYEKQT